MNQQSLVGMGNKEHQSLLEQESQRVSYLKLSSQCKYLNLFIITQVIHKNTPLHHLLVSESIQILKNKKNLHRKWGEACYCLLLQYPSFQFTPLSTPSQIIQILVFGGRPRKIHTFYPFLLLRFHFYEVKRNLSKTYGSLSKII